MEVFRKQIITHELEHEKGYNACLSSTYAATFLKDLEKLVHKDPSKWSTEARDLVEDFFNKLAASGAYAPQFSSQGPFWSNGGIWRRLVFTSEPHARSPQGC